MVTYGDCLDFVGAGKMQRSEALRLIRAQAGNRATVESIWARGDDIEIVFAKHGIHHSYIVHNTGDSRPFTAPADLNAADVGIGPDT